MYRAQLKYQCKFNILLSINGHKDLYCFKRILNLYDDLLNCYNIVEIMLDERNILGDYLVKNIDQYRHKLANDDLDYVLFYTEKFNIKSKSV
jgi:hypothetical protein